MATPTYPELCCHRIEDLELINEREKVFLNKKLKAICQHIVDKLVINQI